MIFVLLPIAKSVETFKEQLYFRTTPFLSAAKAHTFSLYETKCLVLNVFQNLELSVIFLFWRNLKTKDFAAEADYYPANNLLFKFINRNTFEVNNKDIVNFEHFSHLFLVFLLLTLNRWFFTGKLVAHKEKSRFSYCFSRQVKQFCVSRKRNLSIINVKVFKGYIFL